MKSISFTVNAKDGGATLIKYLSNRLKVSARGAKRLIDERNVLVNRRRTWMARHVLHPGDVIEISAAGKQKDKASEKNVLFSDEHYVIINKKAGITANGSGSAESAFRSLLRDKSISAVHRLDRETSGCLIFARGTEARERAIELFREHAVKKTYRAIVSGRVKEGTFRINTPIDGKSALTVARTIRSGKTASHLELYIETGRTHQIRKHLASTGHYVLGDKVYGRVSGPVSDSEAGVVRQMLHASEISFCHPFSGKRLHIKAPIPHDFLTRAKKLRIS